MKRGHTYFIQGFRLSILRAMKRGHTYFIQGFRLSILRSSLPYVTAEDGRRDYDGTGHPGKGTTGLEYLWQRNQDVVHLWAALNQWCFQPLADEVIAYLHEHGFGLQGIYNMAYDRKGRAIQGVFLFLQKALLV